MEGTDQADARDEVCQDRLCTETHDDGTDPPHSQQGPHIDPQDGQAHEAAGTHHHPAGKPTHWQQHPLQSPAVTPRWVRGVINLLHDMPNVALGLLLTDCPRTVLGHLLDQCCCFLGTNTVQARLLVRPWHEGGATCREHQDTEQNSNQILAAC